MEAPNNEKPKVNVIVAELGTKLYDQISDLIQNPTPEKLQKLSSEYPEGSGESYDHEPDFELMITQNEEILKHTDPKIDLRTWIACQANIAFCSISLTNKEKALQCVMELEELLSSLQVAISFELQDYIRELISEIESQLVE